MSTPVAQASPALGAIRIEGPDAAEFLRAQLTNDVRRLGPDRNFLAAWCDAKGRTRLIARVIAQSGEAFLLVLPMTLVETAITRLKMFVLRARVTLEDASGRWLFRGVLDSPDAPPINETRQVGRTLQVGLPPTIDGGSRTLVLVEQTDNAGDTLAIESDRWQRAMIDAGVPQILPATQDQFVPQMLNLHWLMAIDFAKGCYPGQEIIARLHYRGRLVRRVFRLGFDGPAPAVGSAVLGDGDRDAGSVLQAVGGDAESTGIMLAVVAVEQIGTPLTTVDGATLQVADLPYPTPD